jgi:nucleolar complex protein 3
MCCEAVKKLFKQDKLGQASLGVIKVISGFVKGRNYEVRPEVSLLLFLFFFFWQYWSLNLGPHFC